MPYQPPQVLHHGREAVRSATRAKIRLFGSSGSGKTGARGA